MVDQRLSEAQPTLSFYEGDDNGIEAKYPNLPTDGHQYDVDTVPDFWKGTEDIGVGVGTYDIYSLVPAGRLMVVIDPNGVEHGWPAENSPESGVYLSGKDGLDTTRPPTPVSVDDRYLKFAAEAALYAAQRVFPEEEILAVTKGPAESICVIVDDDEQEYNEDVFYGGDGVRGARPQTEPEMLCGFYHIRAFPPTREIYTDAEVPRLGLDQLDFTTT